MTNRIFHSIEDFVEDNFFREWVAGRLPGEDLYWKNWLNNHPEKIAIFNQARLIVLSLQVNHIEISAQEIEEEVNNFKKKFLTTERSVSNTKMSVYLTGIAASIFVILGICTVLFFNKPLKNTAVKSQSENIFSPAQQLINEINNSESPKLVVLRDGSKITLQKGSRVTYPLSFDKNIRVVHLEGEAFFDVKRDVKKPFLVYSQDLVTKVLGTSFNVRAYKSDKNVQVFVKTGKVSVISKSNFDKEREKPDFQTDGLILTPNQKATYSREREILSRSLVSDPIPLIISKADFKLVFNNTPIKKVFEEMEIYYGIKIVYDEQLVNNCTLKADLSDDISFYDKINIICKSMNGSYEVIDGQMVINSKGCDL